MILAHLERQRTENMVIGVYLDLQLRAVRERLASLQQQRTTPPPGPGYVIQHLPSARSPEGRGVVHRETCHLLEDVAGEHQLPFEARAARIALEDPAGISTACQECRPDAVLRPVMRKR